MRSSDLILCWLLSLRYCLKSAQDNRRTEHKSFFWTYLFDVSNSNVLLPSLIRILIWVSSPPHCIVLREEGDVRRQAFCGHRSKFVKDRLTPQTLFSQIYTTCKPARFRFI